MSENLQPLEARLAMFSDQLERKGVDQDAAYKVLEAMASAQLDANSLSVIIEALGQSGLSAKDAVDLVTSSTEEKLIIKPLVEPTPPDQSVKSATADLPTAPQPPTDNPKEPLPSSEPAIAKQIFLLVGRTPDGSSIESLDMSRDAIKERANKAINQLESLSATLEALSQTTIEIPGSGSLVAVKEELHNLSSNLRQHAKNAKDILAGREYTFSPNPEVANRQLVNYFDQEMSGANQRIVENLHQLTNICFRGAMAKSEQAPQWQALVKQLVDSYKGLGIEVHIPRVGQAFDADTMRPIVIHDSGGPSQTVSEVVGIGITLGVNTKKAEVGVYR